MSHLDDLWYAAKTTRVVYQPPRLLETFGQTSVHYYVVSELLDEVGKIRIRQGRVVAERPAVINPRDFLGQALENFGKEARKYLKNFFKSQENLRIIEYGIAFRKEEYKEELVQGNVEEVADQITADVKDNDALLAGVIIGVDDLWEVPLLDFVGSLVKRSVPHNVREMAGRGILDLGSGRNSSLDYEIEEDFAAAGNDLERVRSLGDKLRKYDLFSKYEDRFFELYKKAMS